MHKKIIAAFGVAGFIMLSYVKVNYAMNYEAALATPEVVTQYAAEEVEESKLVQKEADVVMAAEKELEAYTEGFSETEEDIRKEDLFEEETTQEETTQEETTAVPTLSQINSANLQALDLPEYDPATAVASRVVNISQSEYDMMLRMVEAEATGLDVLSKMLVAGVIVNRVNSQSFPGNIEAVIFQRNDTISQFSPLDDGRYYTVTVTNGTVEAVNRVLAGEDYTQGALYFAAERVVDGNGCWASRHFTELFRYEGHVFFGSQPQ